MHEATVTAIATRKDGKGFKAVLPEYGEVWLTLSDRDTGAVEWKQTYDIAFNVKPGAKGNFYNVTRIGKPALPQAAFNGGTAPSPVRSVDVGPHRAMWEKRISKLLQSGMPEEHIPLHIITCRRLAREGLAADIDGKLPSLPNDDDERSSLDF